MTRRERLERKLEKRIEWADKAAVRSDQRFAAARRIADGIPLGQPILVGHHSERHARRDAERIHSNMSKGVEESHKAEHHAGKAMGLEAQLARSVFSDDDDAIVQLEARIAEREAERDRIKKYNASCRKAAKAGGRGDMGLLSEAQRADIEVTMRVCAYQVGPGGAFPAYALSNLGARIKADKERIGEIRTRQARQAAAEEAGGVTLEVIREYVRVTFAEKPDREILEKLKASGFRWGGGCWIGKASALPDVCDDAEEVRTAAKAQEALESSELAKPQEQRVCVCAEPMNRFSTAELAGRLPGQGAAPPSQYCDHCFRPVRRCEKCKVQLVNDGCPECGVHHGGCACRDCGRFGYHAEGCKGAAS